MQPKKTTMILTQEAKEKACRVAIEVTGKPSITAGVHIALKRFKLKRAEK